MAQSKLNPNVSKLIFAISNLPYVVFINYFLFKTRNNYLFLQIHLEKEIKRHLLFASCCSKYLTRETFCQEYLNCTLIRVLIFAFVLLVLVLPRSTLSTLKRFQLLNPQLNCWQIWICDVSAIKLTYLKGHWKIKLILLYESKLISTSNDTKFSLFSITGYEIWFWKSTTFLKSCRFLTLLVHHVTSVDSVLEYSVTRLQEHSDTPGL